MVKSNALFDAAPRTKPVRPPNHVIRELVDKWGYNEKAARSLAANVAWAVLYRFRNGGPLTTEQRADRSRDMAERLAAAPTGDYADRELIELIGEALSLAPRSNLLRVVKGLAALMVEQSSGPATAPTE